ncbi:MAG: hypothetical protein U5R14_11740 [Gemmatimonadota bacterium]|nr:hypothetical protein [Gemmatimonadota bacterium]
MRPFVRLTVFSLGILLVAPKAGQAQATLGPAIGWHDDYDVGIGAALNVPLTEFGAGVAIMSDFLYFFPEGGVDYLEFNGNLTYAFSDGARVAPYILGGVNVANVSGGLMAESETRLGVNLGGGIYLNLGRLRPTVGVKAEVGGGKGLVLFGHLPFVIGN